MIAANDSPCEFVAELSGQDAAQLRQIIAHASGLLAHKTSPVETRHVLMNVAHAVWRRPSLKALAAEVCMEEDFTVEELRGRPRGWFYVWPRQYFMYLAIVRYGYTASAVGRFLNRDHSTVIHGVRAHTSRAEHTANIPHHMHRSCGQNASVAANRVSMES